MQVIDFAGRAPSPDAIKEAGIGGTVRYLAPFLSGRPNPKCATRAEVEADTAAGLLVALVWESTAGAALGGAAQGQADGRQAAQQAKALGAPAGAVIYAAVDFDATDQQLPAVAAYMNAFRDEVHVDGYRQGTYGSARVVGVMLRDGHCEKAWQTVAWSHGARLQGTPGVCLYQRADQIVVDGTTCDVNDVWEMDWGGWNLNPPPAPAPPTQPNEEQTMINRVHALPDGNGTEVPIGGYAGDTPVAFENRRGLANTFKGQDVWQDKSVDGHLVVWSSPAGDVDVAFA